jgi:hypothetical protein
MSRSSASSKRACHRHPFLDRLNLPDVTREGATKVKWRNAANNIYVGCVNKPHLPVFCAVCSR